MEDPVAEEAAAMRIMPWSRAEKALFLTKFAQFYKDFRKIATFFRRR